jgi:hypothetical protein
MKVTIFNTNIDTEINSLNYHQTFYGALNRQFAKLVLGVVFLIFKCFIKSFCVFVSNNSYPVRVSAPFFELG